MIDPREYDNYIENAGKSNEPAVYNAFNGKLVRPGDELDLGKEDVYHIVASTFAIGFIIYLVLWG